LGSGIWSTPAYDPDTNTIYVTTGTGEQNPALEQWGSALLAIDAETLDVRAYYLLPTHSLENDIEWGSSPTVFTTPQGRKLVAATGKDGGLYVLDAADLSVVWFAQIAVSCICPECGCGSLSTPSYDGKLLYAGSGVTDPELFEDGGMHAFDPDTGDKVWGFPIYGTVIAPTTVANGMLFASTTRGFRVFNAETGEMLFSDDSRGPMYSQPVVADGSIYCTYVRGDAAAWRVPE
jgi:polyvinyl alcohol dehydrogenase (cytochrome)